MKLNIYRPIYVYIIIFLFLYIHTHTHIHTTKNNKNVYNWVNVKNVNISIDNNLLLDKNMY